MLNAAQDATECTVLNSVLLGLRSRLVRSETRKYKLRFANHWGISQAGQLRAHKRSSGGRATKAVETPLGSQVKARIYSLTARMPPKPDPSSSGEAPQAMQPAPPPRAEGHMYAQPEGPGQNEEAMLEQRLIRLIELMATKRHNSTLSNISFEIGRPSLEPTPEMRRNPENPYSRFSIDELFKMEIRSVSNNMANTEQMAQITADIAGLGVPTEHVAGVILKVVIMCASVSSSVYLDPAGTVEFPTGAVPLDSIIAIMKNRAGLRKVCRLYAPVVWNYMLVQNRPPSDWQAMGFQWNARFAAFDTFDYVTNGAAIQPVEGLIRRPTPEETIAHNAHKSMAIDKSNRNERLANTNVEYTGGMLGAEIVRNHRNAINQ
nr:42K protein [Potato virus S]CAI06111.1 5'-extended coat protein [Potato virus S]